jgi:hypothetical protein
VTLAKDQRAQVVAAAAPVGPLPAERNLIVNGNFSTPLDGEWVIEARPPVDPAEEPGQVSLSVIGGRRTANFVRAGRNWGQVNLVQTLDRDVRGYSSLRLHMDLLIDNQDLRNCGIQGTECPLMAKINYVDIYGNSQEWVQGFFYNYDPNPDFGPTFCVTCAPRQWPHQQWPARQWKVYDSENLLDVWSEAGIPAAVIKSVTFLASGHTFNSFITDIQLLAAE